MRKQLFLAISILEISIGLSGQTQLSKHFTIQKLADGVYAAIASNGGYAICNAGIIDLGDATLIFDPFMSPEPAQELKKIALKLTGHPVKYVVNSHFHNDHIGGDQVFDKVDIISTVRTRELIAKFQPQEIESDKKDSPKELKALKSKNLKGMNPHELDEQIMWIGYYEALVRVNDTLKVVLPGISFIKEMIISGSKRSARLLTYGEGHTESDAFLFLPNDKIAFLGDLLFVQNQPWLGDGDPVKWASYLDSIASLKPEKLVPGHGPVGNISNLDSMKIYFEVVKNAAIACKQRGILPSNDSTLKCPSPYNGWFLSSFYIENVKSEYDRMYKK
ncbi:MAG: MBL fold metallo-hydrolase [Chitinophagales bacterium]